VVHRYPILPVLIALVLGILADRFASISWNHWIVTGILSLSCWAFFYYKSITRFAIFSLLIACVSVGGIRHHSFWHLSVRNSIERFLSEERQLVSLKATVLTSPEIVEVKRPWNKTTVFHSQCVLRCKQLFLPDSSSVAVAGKIRLSIKDKTTDLHVGDIVKVVGWISKPSRPQNPGQFDFREYLKRDGIEAILTIEKAAGIEHLETSCDWFLKIQRLIERSRKKYSQQIDASLDKESASIAKAVLLGNRSQLDEEFVKDFAESGLIHILAISGLHVGIFLAPFWLIFHLLKLSPLWKFLLTTIVLVFFILLTGARPSVLRASLVVTIFMGGAVSRRRSSLLNAISFSAVVILLRNPTSLFDIGTQLSFLSVFGIFVASRWMNLFDETPSLSKIEEIIEEHRGDWFRLGKKLGKRFFQAMLISFGIWVTILPILVHTFHLVSVAGLFVNVFFIPLVGIFLWCGYSFLLTAFLLPFLAPFFSVPFQFGIHLLRSFVSFIDLWEFGHFYFAGPPVWWIVCHYFLLILSCVIPRRAIHKSLFVSLILLWLGIGTGLGFREHRPGHLECTFLAVGHGVAILLEFPDGRVILYDSGSMTSSRHAARVVSNALWSKGHSKIDAVFISHADHDHFNAIPEIFDRFPVEKIYLTTQFLDYKQAETIRLFEVFQNRSVPVEFVARGEEISFDEVHLKVLHPRGIFRYDNDNANSMVVSVEYQRRRILLTGDLEKNGMDELLEHPAFDVDVLLAPHHGSRHSNPVELAQWATPELVVISGGRSTNLDTIRNRYDKQTQIYLTAQTGAVAVRIDPDGRIQTKPFRPRKKKN